MNELYEISQTYINEIEISFRRSFIDEIDWSNRMIAILGARGVGKTTLMLQYIKENYKDSSDALFVSMDHVGVADLSLLDIAKFHVQRGGKFLCIDEIHKCEQWSKELKTIYDTYKKLKVVASSSSILELYKGEADLSRRVVMYKLSGLSLREYIQIETGKVLPKYDLQDILKSHVAISQEILNEGIRPLKYFDEYTKYGYYPFYLENRKSYPMRLLNVINHTLDTDLIYIKNVDISYIFKLKKLLSLLSASVPFQPNISKLASALEISRNTVLTYLYYLQQAELIHLVTEKDKSFTVLSKPEKVLLHNSNIMYSLKWNNADIGTMRETFFVNQLSYMHKVNTSIK